MHFALAMSPRAAATSDGSPFLERGLNKRGDVFLGLKVPDGIPRKGVQCACHDALLSDAGKFEGGFDVAILRALIDSTKVTPPSAALT